MGVIESRSEKSRNRSEYQIDAIGGASRLRPFLHTFFQNFSLSWNLPGRNPKYARGGDGIDSPPPPPGDFVSEAMVVPVMGSAQWHREFVADLAPCLLYTSDAADE